MKLFRSALEPLKPRDLLRDELEGKLGEYTASILMDDDAQEAGQLADDIRKLMALDPLNSAPLQKNFKRECAQKAGDESGKVNAPSFLAPPVPARFSGETSAVSL